jgi:hypothetical protein
MDIILDMVWSIFTGSDAPSLHATAIRGAVHLLLLYSVWMIDHTSWLACLYFIKLVVDIPLFYFVCSEKTILYSKHLIGLSVIMTNALTDITMGYLCYYGSIPFLLVPSFSYCLISSIDLCFVYLYCKYISKIVCYKMRNHFSTELFMDSFDSEDEYEDEEEDAELSVTQIETVLNTPVNTTNIDDNCAVCMSQLNNHTMKLMTMPVCKHTFHGSCLIRCLMDNDQCPLCRSSIPRSTESN